MRLLSRGAVLALVFAVASTPALAGQVTAGGGRSGGGGPGPTTAINGPTPIVAAMPAGNSAISGVVTDGVSGRPLANAVVSLSLQTVDPNGAARRPSQLQQTTDSKGRFVFADLPAGDRFVLNATRFAYFDGGYGRRPDTDAASAPRIVLADRQWFSRADIQLWPAGAISGTVTDERGEPIVGAFVRVLRQFVVAGSKQLAAGPTTTTDDRGQYRIYGLDPGTYLVNVPSVQASVPVSTPAATAEPAIDRDGATRRIVGRYPTAPSGQGPLVYASAFHPSGSTVAQAEAVTLDYGSNPTNVDVRLDPVSAFRVSGRIDGPIDVASKLTLRLMAEGSEDLGIGSEAATALAGADGSFTFLDVPGGDYILDARSTSTQLQVGSSINQPRMPNPPGVTSFSMTSTTIASGPANVGLTTIVTGAGDKFWARQPIHVGGRDLTNIALALHPAVSLSGHFVFQGAAPPPSFLLVTAESADARPSQGMLTNRISPQQSADQFQIDGLLAGDYVLRMRPPDPWVVKSIVADGRDYAAKPFDAAAGHDFSDVVVTLTDKGATIAGSVRAAAGAPIDSAAVILFPSDRAGWTHYGFSPDRIKSTIVNTGGTFRFAALPAGNYEVIAVDRSHLRAWQDPAFLEAASRQSTHVTVDWGETKSADLSLVTIK